MFSEVLSYARIALMNTRTTQKSPKNLKLVSEIRIERPERMKLTAEESLRRMNDFDKRKDDFIAAIRKSKG